MSVHLSEEEQIEVFKRWWKENGKFVAVAIVAAVVGYFAWTGWKDKQQSVAEDASARYETLVKLLGVESGKKLTEADRATAEQIANELKSKNSKTIYAQSAAFFLAKLAVEGGDLDKAGKELQWVLDAKPDVATSQLAHVRLARVLIAKGAYDDALKQIAEEPSKAFAAEYAEVRGDILKAQGNNAAALTAYEKALADTDPQAQERTMVLRMKADDLRLPEGQAAAQVPAAATTEKAQ
ncbi:MAG TPA: tetratricopeptide repeat protein [Cellvibrio sp.]|nr:tetratricopeptide repeat protein [Cellvibrio sp.]